MSSRWWRTLRGAAGAWTRPLERGNAQKFGGDIEEVTPDPIPNSEVKLFGANGTAGGTQWESRSLPEFFFLK
jgi:hypothetical protein